MSASAAVTLSLGDEVQAIANAVAAVLTEEFAPRAAWLDVQAAADYLACPPSRIYDLVAQRRVRVARDGTRLRFRTEWLDAVLEVEEPEP
jgi:excisionase family DNA binding protein